MADRREDAEDRLLKRLRLASGVVVLLMIVLLVVSDVFGRLFVDPGFHVNEIIVGTMVGALLALLGIETLLRLPKKNGDS